MKLSIQLLAISMLICSCSSVAQENEEWTSLFNGEDLSGWVTPEGDGDKWAVVDGVIDYNADSEAEGDKNLWSEEEYGDFKLRVEWRLKETPFVNQNVMLIRPDGSHKRNAHGDPIRIAMPDSDSGVYVRGTSKAQINMWSWPIGSGEVYGYRTDSDLPAEIAAGVTPSMMADNDIGEWNEFIITMDGDLLSVELNGHLVIDEAQLPDVPERGPIALQHHGSKENGEWVSPPSLVQFRNISIQEME
ncbi:MAG: DUF1080 domain-containing protein [Balneolaceae bacterium]